MLLNPFLHVHSQDPNWGVMLLTQGRPHLSECSQDCACDLNAFSEVVFDLNLLGIKTNHDKLLFIPAWTGLYLEEKDTGTEETMILV